MNALSHVCQTRLIGSYIGEKPGHTLVITGGIHGNEPAGVHAVTRVLNFLHKHKPKMAGRIYGLVGNQQAMLKGMRYQNRDLNRVWRPEIIHGPSQDCPEYAEMMALKAELDQIIATTDGPITHLDLHTFSNDGAPFVIADDCDGFSDVLRGLPFPTILGLTDKIEGTLSNYLSSIGHRSMAIEGGQHNHPMTINNLECFLWLFLYKRGYLKTSDLEVDIDPAWQRIMSQTEHLPRQVRIFYRHAIGSEDFFKMFPGYFNFTFVQEGVPLATDRHGMVTAPSDGCMLMPLYQGQGNDGFFLGQVVA